MRAIVVGSGISGLVAARTLSDAGCAVRVVEKHPVIGGRLATTVIGGAIADSGAQFFTVRTPAFARRVEDWERRGLVTTWCHGFGTDDGHPRYVALNGMRSIVEDLASGIRVDTSTMAFAVRPTDDRRSPWQLVTDDGAAHHADALIVTSPLPQAFALLADTDLPVDDPLLRTDYDRTIAYMVRLSGPPRVGAPGGLQAPTDDIAFVADNIAKGITHRPTLTLHAGTAWSERHWDLPPESREASLRLLAAPWLGDAEIVASQVVRWRFATPQRVLADPCWVSPDGRIVLAGDAFAGPRVEGAHNSGLAAAHALIG